MATAAVRLTAAFSTRRNSSEPTPMNRESYPPATATDIHQRMGSTAVKAR